MFSRKFLSINSINTYKTTPIANLNTLKLATYRKSRTIGKPRPRVRSSITGELTVRVTRLKEKYRWKDWQIRDMMAFLNRHVNETDVLPETERLPKLQNMLNDYISGLWGRKLAVLRSKLKARQKIRVKRRAQTKVARKIKLRQLHEDFRELQVIHNRERALREQSGRNFSFKKYLRAIREAKNVNTFIRDEAEFEKFLRKEIDTKFIRGPASARRKHHPTINYQTVFKRDVIDPMVYYMKKKAYITSLVQAREDALHEEKVKKEIAERRAARAIERNKNKEERKARYNEVMKEYHAEVDRFKTLKYEYWIERQKVFSKSRLEYLEVLNTTINRWKTTPDECKLMRFQFGDSIKFPFNGALYQ